LIWGGLLSREIDHFCWWLGHFAEVSLFVLGSLGCLQISQGFVVLRRASAASESFDHKEVRSPRGAG
jgi:hypothetical protein